MATKWCAQIYKEAAERHLCTCTQLKKDIEVSTKSSVTKQLKLSFYYLSGYIAECYLKYAILTAMHKERQQFNLVDLNDIGLKTHELKALYQKLNEESGKEIIVNLSHWPEATKQWSEQHRYIGSNNIGIMSSLDDHFAFINEKILTPIKREY